MFSGNNHSVGRDVVKLSVTKIITALLSLVTVMLLSRFRSLEEYGTYSQLLMVISIFSSIFMLGLPNSINYFLGRAETNEEKKKFLSVYYTFSTLLSFIIGVILVIILPLIVRYFQNPYIKLFVYFLVIFPWASVILSSIDNLLIVFHKTGLLFIFRISYGICLLGSILLVQFMSWNFQVYMIFFTGVSVIFALVVYLTAGYLTNGIDISFDFKLFKQILSFSLPIGLASVVGILTLQTDKLLIGKMMDTTHLAIYVNSSQELPVSMISGAFTSVLLPKLAGMLKHRKYIEAVRLWSYATELSFICICFISAGVFSYASDVITFLYSDKYISGVSVFRVYALILLFRCTYFGILLNAIGRTRVIFICSIATLILNAILSPIFYFCLGIIGPAIATLISLLIVTLCQLKFTAMSMKLTLSEIFPWRGLCRILVVNILFSCCFIILKNVISMDQSIGQLFESIVLGIVWGFMYYLFMKKKICYLWDGLNSGDLS